MAATRRYNMQSRRRWLWLAMLPLGMLLAGCGTGSWFSAKGGPTPQCPRVGILGDARAATIYRPDGGRDLTDVAYEHELLDYSGNCKYTKDLTSVTISLMLQVAGTRGPAATANETRVPYFVAVVDKQQNVISRELFEARVPFPPGRRRIAVGEELEQTIPFGTGRAIGDVEVLIGLVLNSEQLENNRRTRGF